MRLLDWWFSKTLSVFLYYFQNKILSAHKLKKALILFLIEIYTIDHGDFTIKFLNNHKKGHPGKDSRINNPYPKKEL